jgi:DNA helicase-2/ATP-dependent DNA helicase PcrA
MPHLLDQLNPQQRAAVEVTEGPLLILAGAGSGKTRVITYRVAYLIEARGVAPENILAVTFTNKAADQMRERVAALLGPRAEQAPLLCTFHSFCARVLRRNIDALGYSRDFTIYDEDDQQRVIKASLKELAWDEQFFSPRAALGRISFAKNHGLSPEALRQRADNPQAEKLAVLYDLYERKLRQAQALDFDDLLLKAVELLYTAPRVCEHYNRRFLYLLVDEYQDTNRIQYQLIRQLTLTHQNLCAVGDEDQSIYRWRGADIENILSFEKDYPATRLIRLEQNYRSTQRILDAATAVVSHNLARKGKTLWTDRGGGSLPVLMDTADAEEESLLVADEVARRLEASETASVAVLYRVNSQSRLFEEALRRRGIEYRLVGGFSFFARAEVKDALAYARLVNNPQDSAAFLRIVNTPARGIGEATLALLAAAAERHQLSLWEAVEHTLKAGRLPPRPQKALEGFATLIRKLCEDRQRLSLADFFKSILERSGYLAMLREESLPESSDRAENLWELVNAAGEAEARGEPLADFLDHAALISDADDYDERARVTLMTLHSAKGLEFSTVFLVGLEEGLFPHQLSLDDQAALEEERRLCYVGMTRAKDHLLLTWAHRRRGYGRESYEETEPSRFLSEIPTELLETAFAGRGFRKPPTTWENALNSVASVEQYLQQRGIRTKLSAGRGEADRAAASSGRRWRIGTQVRHPKYGLGTILECEGEGEETKLTVSFPGFGRKKLMLRFASLEKV